MVLFVVCIVIKNLTREDCYLCDIDKFATWLYFLKRKRTTRKNKNKRFIFLYASVSSRSSEEKNIRKEKKSFSAYLF